MTQQNAPIPGTILIVDDVEDTRDMYAEYLRHCGFTVITATDGAQGLDAARAHRPDLILMDVTMPGLDGWMATRLLKQDALIKNIPVIILSAHVFTEHRDAAHESGADGFIAKPCLPDELAREVKAALQRWRSTSDRDNPGAKDPQVPDDGA